MDSDGTPTPDPAHLETRRMYDAVVVDEHIADLEATIEAQQREITDLQNRLAEGHGAQQHPDPAPNRTEAEVLIGRALLSAQRNADEIAIEAERRADAMVADARRQADDILAAARLEAAKIVDGAQRVPGGGSGPAPTGGDESIAHEPADSSGSEMLATWGPPTDLSPTEAPPEAPGRTTWTCDQSPPRLAPISSPEPGDRPYLSDRGLGSPADPSTW